MSLHNFTDSAGGQAAHVQHRDTATTKDGLVSLAPLDSGGGSRATLQGGCLRPNSGPSPSQHVMLPACALFCMLWRCLCVHCPCRNVLRCCLRVQCPVCISTLFACAALLPVCALPQSACAAMRPVCAPPMSCAFTSQSTNAVMLPAHALPVSACAAACVRLPVHFSCRHVLQCCLRAHCPCLHVLRCCLRVHYPVCMCYDASCIVTAPAGMCCDAACV